MGSTRPSHKVLTTAHEGTHARVAEGAGVLLTRSERHAMFRLCLPGTTLFSSAFSYRALVSHNTLLRHGYRVSLSTDHGHVTTPDGDVIHLEVRDGLYHFPEPASQVPAGPASGPCALPMTVRPSTRRRPTEVSCYPAPGELPPVRPSSCPGPVVPSPGPSNVYGKAGPPTADPVRKVACLETFIVCGFLRNAS